MGSIIPVQLFYKDGAIKQIEKLFFKSLTCCSILNFDPAKHAIPKMRKLHIPLAWASLTDNMGQG